MIREKNNSHTCDFIRGKYWHTYKYLENIIIDVSKYITIDPDNDDTWSEVLASSLVLNGNAVDTFLRNMIFLMKPVWVLPGFPMADL